jgi:hypothetical protein
MQIAGPTPNSIFCRWYGTTGTNDYQFDNTLDLDAWVHLLLVWDRDNPNTDAVCYKNGVNQGTPDFVGETISGKRTGMDTLVLGNVLRGAANAWQGALAEFTMYDGLLGQAEATALSSGNYSPFEVEPSAIAFCSSLYNENTGARDLVSGVAPTEYGTCLTMPHPPIQQTSRIIQRYATPPRLPARYFVGSTASSHPAGDHWGPHIYKRGNRSY